MKILVFGLDIKYIDYECKFVYNDESFYNEIFKNYDVLIINFEFLSSFLEVKNFFKGIVIFVGEYEDELIYKKALELGDYFYTFKEIWKIPYRLKYISKKVLKQKNNLFIFKNLIFNLKTKELYKNRENIKLSPAEREILYLITKNKNKFISKEEMVEESDNIDNVSSVKVIVSNLRRVGFKIENQKNLGYKIKEK